MNLPELLNTIVGPGIGWLQGEALRASAPKAPELRESVTWGGYTGREGGRMRPYRPGEFATPQEMREQAAEALQGVSFPAGTEQYVEDQIRGYEEAMQRRSQEEQALAGFSENLQRGMGKLRGEAAYDYQQAMRTGTEGFRLARQELDLAKQTSTKALAGTVASTSEMVEQYKGNFERQIQEMRNLKGEMLAEATNESANLLVQHARGVDMATRARVEDAVANATAAGLPQYQIVNLAEQIRMDGARDVGDQMRQMSTERQYQIDQLRLAADTNIAQMKSTFTGAFGSVTQAAIGEIGGAYGTWADRQRAVADSHRMLSESEAMWRYGMNQNKNWIETQIREADLRGAVIEKAALEGMTVPSMRLGPIAEGAFNVHVGVMSTEFAWDQAAYANEAGIANFQMENMWKGFDNYTSLWIAERQAEAQEKAAEYAMYGSIAGGVGTAVGGIATGGLPLLAGTAAVGATAPKPRG